MTTRKTPKSKRTSGKAPVAPKRTRAKATTAPKRTQAKATTAPKRARAKARPEPSYASGEEVHWIQAAKGMRAMDRWRQGSLLGVDGYRLTIRFDTGVTGSFYCRHSADVAAIPREVQLLRDGLPLVIVVEGWSLLVIPVGVNGRPPPTRLVFGGVVELEGASAVAGISDEPSHSMRLFSVREVGPKDPLPPPPWNGFDHLPAKAKTQPAKPSAAPKKSPKKPSVAPKKRLAKRSVVSKKPTAKRSVAPKRRAAR